MLFFTLDTETGFPNVVFITGSYGLGESVVQGAVNPDVFSHDRSSLPIAWSALAANAEDPAFLGYPYGLLDADKFAQVTKDETAQFRAHFAVRSKESFSNIERALDAHDLLNSF